MPVCCTFAGAPRSALAHFSCNFAGHSLGGALAHLAAYDITKAFPGVTVRVYTFGSPRHGLFARPLLDCWHCPLHLLSHSSLTAA